MIIAGTLGASLMLTVVSLSWRDKPLTDKGGEVVIATVSGLLVALGYYMGSKQND